MMPPWLFALIVLIGVCVIGWYVIYSRHAGVPSEEEEKEGFNTPSRASATACETAFSACLNESGQTEGCTSTYNTCIANIARPSVSTVANAGTTGKSASSAVAARGTPAAPVADDYQALAGQALTGQLPTLTPELKAFMEQIKGKSSIEYPAPSAGQLGAAQGNTGSSVPPGTLLNNPAVYKAFQQIIKPHQTPTAVQPGLTATQKGADAVQANAILTPSMRQQIRDDVKKAVGEEMGALQNEYEITYENQ